jgi:copper homeostasis protein
LILEICAYNIHTCLIAEKAGASRIELCADPAVGGTTPSYGLLTYVLEHLSIPVFPMIRPRGGNFIYDDHELAIMKQDILTCRQLGFPGIATGIQLPGGCIDTKNLSLFVEWAHPMSVTCHKAFDRTPDAMQALEDVIATGCTRILTSGLKETAPAGAAVLAQLVAQAAGRIIIMPGGGVRAANLSQLINDTHATEYHSSGLTTKSTDFIADEQEIKAMVEKLNP